MKNQKKNLLIIIVFFISIFLIAAQRNEPYGGSKGYKEYVALISQNGTNAPTAIVLENTLGVEITYKYHGDGQYSLYAPKGTHLFLQNKTAIWVGNGTYLETYHYTGNDWTIQLLALVGDSTLDRSSIFIRVYP